MSSTSTGRDRMRFDRSDSVATQLILWLLVGASAAYSAFIIIDWALRRQVTLTEVPVQAAEDAAGAGRVLNPVAAEVVVDDVGAGHFVLLLVGSLLTVAAAVWAAVLLTRFLGDLADGDPFGPANVTRLRIVAALLLVVPLVASVVIAIARAEILEAAGAEAGFALSFSLGWIAAGLLVAAIAQAFATGTRLRSDVDGLV